MENVFTHYKFALPAKHFLFIMFHYADALTKILLPKN